jgi:O-antigen/teichoic acid export membrane protein
MPHRKTIAIVATTSASLVGRASSLLSQAIVGVYLTEAEVGLYAASLGIMGITGVWRSGGTATYLPSSTPEEFPKIVNPMFLWALSFGLATTLLTLAVAALDDRLPEALSGYKVPGLRAVLVVMAIRSVLFPVALIGRMRLAVEHRFTPLAKVDTLNAVLRLLLTWLIASAGGGTLALAVPYAAGTLVEAIAAWMLDGYRWSDFKPAFGRLRNVAPLLAWPLVLAVLMSIRADISFLLIGLMLPAAALGVFYFAFQLANQPAMLLQGSLQNVLAPMLARARGQEVAERLGLEQVLAMAMLFVPVTTMAAASLFPPVEELVWGGKWAPAGPSVTALCIGATYATVAGLLFGPLIGLRQFRKSAGFEVIKMLGIIGGAGAGALLIRLAPGAFADRGGDVTAISTCVAAGMTLTSIAQLLWIARQYRFDLGNTVRNLTFGPLLAGLTAVAAQSIGHSLFMSLGTVDGRVGALIELTAIGTTYFLLIVLAVRFTAEPILRDTVDTFPAPAKALMQRLLVLR